MAGLASAFVPGLGHALLGRWRRGAVYVGLIVALVAAAVLAPELIGEPNRQSNGLFQLAEGIVGAVVLLIAWTACAVATFAVWLSQLMDAVRCARAARQAHPHLYATPAATQPASIQPVVGPQHCPFCRERVEGDPGVACTACLARHHASCWTEHGKCAACGNRSRLVAAPDDAPDEGAPADGEDRPPARPVPTPTKE